MNDTEFEVLDQLYFMISWSDLLAKLQLDENILIQTLNAALEKKWVQAYQNPDALPEDSIILNHENVQTLYFLATKKGLFAHNQV